MQLLHTTKPRAVYVEATGTWIARDAGKYAVAPTIDAALTRLNGKKLADITRNSKAEREHQRNSL